jgi:hypothetical protein
MFLQSVSTMSKGSKFSNTITSSYNESSIVESIRGKATNGDPGEYEMIKLKIKPTIK